MSRAVLEAGISESTLKYKLEDLRRAWYRFKKNKLSIAGLSIILFVVFMAIAAPYISPYPEDAGAVVKFEQAYQPPSWEHLFGTDEAGRDVLSRVIFGARYSLTLAFVVLTIAVCIGVPLGLIAGLYKGLISDIIMRVTDVFLALPSIVLALAVTVVLSPSLINVMWAMAFGWWPWYTRLVYGEALSVKQEDFVEAAKLLGASKIRIAFKEILPNCISPIIVKITLDMGFVILAGAGLSFLGLGAQPPTPDWGTMMSEGRSHLPTIWWPTVFPGLAVCFTVLGFNLLGDGLRDVLDVEVT